MVGQSILVGTALHEEYQLGQLVATYQTQSTRAGKIVFWGAILFCLLIVVGLVSLFLWFFTGFNDPFFSPIFFIIMIGFTTVPLGLALLSFFLQLRDHRLVATPIRRKIVISLYERGFIYREGRRLKVATWDQIRSIDRIALPRKKLPRRYYKLALKDADEITLPIVIAHIQELGTTLESEMVKKLLTGIVADYEAHKPLVFPGFCINQGGVSKSDESLSWSQIELISLADEKLTIKEKGIKKDWFAIPAAQVRNICVLEGLLGHIKEEQDFDLEIPS